MSRAKLKYHEGPSLERQARYLQSIACLVKDAAKHDELLQEAEKLFLAAESHKKEKDAER